MDTVEMDDACNFAARLVGRELVRPAFYTDEFKFKGLYGVR